MHFLCHIIHISITLNSNVILTNCGPNFVTKTPNRQPLQPGYLPLLPMKPCFHPLHPLPCPPSSKPPGDPKAFHLKFPGASPLNSFANYPQNSVAAAKGHLDQGHTNTTCSKKKNHLQFFSSLLID
jgi:hypothetical protein